MNTQDLKLTVYGLAEDGRNGTVASLFRTQGALEAHVWNEICPNSMTVGDLMEKHDGDLCEAHEKDGPDLYTWSEDELTIDMTTVPAIAALIQRNAELETFRAHVAGFPTAQDALNDLIAAGEEITSVDELERSLEDLMENDEYSDKVIDEARALASPDAAPVGDYAATPQKSRVVITVKGGLACLSDADNWPDGLDVFIVDYDTDDEAATKLDGRDCTICKIEKSDSNVAAMTGHFAKTVNTTWEICE